MNPISETKNDYVGRCFAEETRNLQKLEFSDPQTKRTEPEEHISLATTIMKLTQFNNFFNQLTNEQITKYNKELDQYKLDYKIYLEKRHTYEHIISLSFPIELILNNVGTAPANDIDIWMHFPDGFLLINKDKLPKAPKRPSLPYKPKSKFDIDRNAFSSFMPNLTFPSQRQPSLDISKMNFNKPDIRETNSYEVNVQIKSLKHHQNFKVDPLIVVFDKPENISNFQISYRLLIGNLPQPIEGQLNIKVSQTKNN